MEVRSSVGIFSVDTRAFLASKSYVDKWMCARRPSNRSRLPRTRCFGFTRLLSKTPMPLHRSPWRSDNFLFVSFFAANMLTRKIRVCTKAHDGAGQLADEVQRLSLKCTRVCKSCFCRNRWIRIGHFCFIHALPLALRLKKNSDSSVMLDVLIQN